MNLYKKTEYLLYNYKQFKVEIKNILLEIEDIENEVNGISAISYEEKSAPTNKFNSSVENEIEQKENRIEYLNRLINKKKNMIQRVDNTLEVLSDRDKYIVEEYYINRNQLKNISKHVDLEESYLSTYKNNLINKVANIMFVKE